MDLDDMRVFAHVAEAGGITEAARTLGMPKQTVSRRLAALEERLGVVLALRTTRHFALTDLGRAFAQRCDEMTRLAEEAHRSVMSGFQEVSGILRVTADHTFGEAFLPDVVSAYANRYPEVDVEIVLTARKVDLLEEGFDAAFRIGPPPNVHHLAATRLGPAELWTVASPAYVSRHGKPCHPDDLREHRCVSFLPQASASAWPFAQGGGLRRVPVTPRIRVNGTVMAHRLVLSGLGVGHLPRFVAEPSVEHGKLVRLLEPFSPEVGGIHVVYPHARMLTPKLREFLTLLEKAYPG